MKSKDSEINKRRIRVFLPRFFCIALILCVLTVHNTVWGSKKSSQQARTSPASLVDPDIANELICVNFDQVDIRIMLKTIGDITGINFVVDDKVKGRVTVMSPAKIRIGELYNVMESFLEVNGYAAIPAGDFVKIVPKTKAIKQNLQVRIGADPAEIPQNDSYVTQIIPLKYTNVAEVANIVKPLMAVGSHMSTYTKTNSIIITDTSSNIHHIATIIQKLDMPASKEQFSVITLEYASAEILSKQIIRIMEKRHESNGHNLVERNSTKNKTGIIILPDARTNSLIVVANEQDTKTISKFVSDLDIQRPTRANNVHVIYLKNAPAKETAESLGLALGNLRIAGAINGAQNVQVTADEGTNSLIVTASPQDYEVISEIVEKLDIVREQVLVEMMIMEVSKEGLKEIGIDWANLDSPVEGSTRGFAVTNFGPRVDFANSTFEGLSIGLWRGSNIGAILNILEKQTGVNILSTPHITTSNHQKARIVVGENRPFVTESRITETTDLLTPTVIKTFEYIDVGISLDIVPHISQDGLVRLEIESQFTKLIEDVTTTSTDTPTRAKREAQTVVSMQSGSTIVIGGLIRDDKTSVEKKVPLVGDLPLVGGLFRYEKEQLDKTNLLIFITPHVLTSQEDLDNSAKRKKDEMRSEIELLLDADELENSSRLDILREPN